MAKSTTKASSISMIALAPDSALVAIRRLVDTNLALAKRNAKRQGIMLWGQPGAGKSDLIFQLAEQMNYKVIDLRLNQIDSVDLRGIPATHPTETGELTVRWAVPEIFPRITDAATREAKIEKPKHLWKNENVVEYYDGAFIFLDEITNAPGLVQTSAYQLVLDAMLGEYIVPSNVVVTAAGNRETDRSNAQRMSSALANRFTHLELKVDTEQWQRWALSKAVNKTVVSFVAAHPDAMDFSAAGDTSSKGYCTPRSAVALSNILGNDDLKGFSDDVRRALVLGTIGDGAGAKFIQYMDSTVDLPDPKKILSGEIRTIDDIAAPLQRHIAFSLCYLLRDIYQANEAAGKGKDEINEKVQIFLEFIERNFISEMIMVAIYSLFRNFEVRFETNKVPMWSTVAKKYAPMLRS